MSTILFMANVNRKLFLEEHIGRLLFKFIAPASLGMLSIAICGIFDTIFVGKFVGTFAIAALTLALPLFMIISALANTIGVGGAAIWSLESGAKNYDKANKVFGNAVFLLLVTGISLSFTGYFFIDYVLQFLGTPSDVYAYAKSYISIFSLAAIFILFTIGLNSFIRAEGKPKIAMTILFVAAFLNIALDVLFIVIFKWGITGAALAILGANATSAAMVVGHFAFDRTIMKFSQRSFSLDPAILYEIIKVGTASFCRQISIGVMHYIVNISVVWYAGASAGLFLAIAGISMKCIMFILMPVIGVTQGMQPIIGFNYGAKNYPRAKKAIILAMITASCIASVTWLVIMINPKFVLGLFSNDQILIEKGYNIIRLIVLMMPIVAAQTTGAGLFQILKKTRLATSLALLRQVFLMVPIVLIMPLYFRLDGIWYGIPVADFLACFITVFWVYREIKILEKLHFETIPID